MSVYTPVTIAELEALLGPDLPVLALEPIHHGIENSNFFVTLRLDDQPVEAVLTVFEALRPSQLPFFIDLLARLAAVGLPVPAALPLGLEQPLQLGDKPALISRRLHGEHPLTPTPAQCHEIGNALATLHGATLSLSARPPQDWPLDHCLDRGRFWQAQLAGESAATLAAAVARLATVDFSALPTGLVHADLFRDNTLFVGDALTGLLDFYAACEDAWLYDLAVTANDFCRAADGAHLAEDLVAALLAGYQQQRPLTAAERAAWPDMLLRAALRFWLSRLEQQAKNIAEGVDPALVQTKDPREFERVAAAHLAGPVGHS